MGIRPRLSFVVGLKLLHNYHEKEGKCTITDERWYLPEGTRNKPVFGPSEEEMDRSHKEYKADKENSEKFRWDMYLWMANGFNHCPRRVDDYLEFDNEYGIPGWAFYVLRQLPYDHDCLWALAAIHPEYHTRSSFIEIPQVETEDNAAEDAYWWKASKAGVTVPYPHMVSEYQRRLDDKHLYNTFYRYSDGYIDCAYWFFNRILGFHPLERKELRLGLLWTWR